MNDIESVDMLNSKCANVFGVESVDPIGNGEYDITSDDNNSNTGRVQNEIINIENTDIKSKPFLQ